MLTFPGLHRRQVPMMANFLQAVEDARKQGWVYKVRAPVRKNLEG